MVKKRLLFLVLVCVAINLVTCQYDQFDIVPVDTGGEYQDIVPIIDYNYGVPAFEEVIDNPEDQVINVDPVNLPTNEEYWLAEVDNPPEEVINEDPVNLPTNEEYWLTEVDNPPEEVIIEDPVNEPTVDAYPVDAYPVDAYPVDAQPPEEVLNEVQPDPPIEEEVQEIVDDYPTVDENPPEDQESTTPRPKKKRKKKRTTTAGPEEVTTCEMGLQDMKQLCESGKAVDGYTGESCQFIILNEFCEWQCSCAKTITEATTNPPTTTIEPPPEDSDEENEGCAIDRDIRFHNCFIDIKGYIKRIKD